MLAPERMPVETVPETFISYRDYLLLAEDIGQLDRWLNLWHGLLRLHFDYLAKSDQVKQAVNEQTTANINRWLKTREIYAELFDRQQNLSVTTLTDEEFKKLSRGLNGGFNQDIVERICGEVGVV